MDSIIKECELKMDKAFSSFQKELSKIRGGAVSKSIFDDIKVDYYGAQTPLNQLCNINTNEASTIILTPYDASVADEVVKSIQKSDLGFNPNNDDGVIIINVPPLTQERRQELVKFLNKQSEAFKVSVRNVRKEANDEIKKSLKNKEITEDQEKSGLKKIQDQTDIFIQKISDETSIKEKEITNI
ncbi:MAG: ribosome recycling factor [bacterium]|jgi:ribosome recycling factor|tara:strand:- start:5247 stop:5801 length:555 start_codon:yes stop_codon:yes gene_type:complete